MYCIATKNLSYKFSEAEIVLNNLAIEVPYGSIYGFLGPNGAGKTTTLRLILGLLKRQTGSIQIFEKDFELNRIDILRRIGSLIESPSIYGHLTARENLLLLQKIYQCPIGRIGEVLTLVGLAHTGSKKAGQFSLGMKQRLSIAIALMNDPALLILDEPTNGLDPNGILEIRELLKRLNEQKGITVLISSHLLSEIEKLVTHVGIIHQGNLMFQGTLADLISKQQESSHICIETNHNSRALHLLHSLDLAARIEGDSLVLPVLPKTEVAKINALFVQENIEVYQIATVRNDLESIFMQLINN